MLDQYNHRCLLCVLLFFFVVVVPSSIVSADEPAEFRVPEGFRVRLYAGDQLAHDIYSMTLDAQGRVVVAGRGYVKTLYDDDGDGQADRAKLFAAEPVEGARGLYFDGPDLICTGDNALARYCDQDRDGVADGPCDVLAELKQRGDHSANGVVQGPDGWFYVACGNDAGVTAQHNSGPGAPVARPRQGVVFRCSMDGRQTESLAHGFRNPYDLAFAADGALLMVDADGERDQYLPWYSPTRLFDIAPGMHHGWMLPGWVRSWNRPAWFFDTVPRLVEIGRGSPTGAVVYRHRQFPIRYRGAMFSCCWSLGRIYALHVKPKSDSYVGQMEVFLEPTGSSGFAPVDVAVGTQGEMYVAIGGRGTRGGVYRIDYGESKQIARLFSGERDSLHEVLTADQPLASWSRFRWAPMARNLGGDAFTRAAMDEKLPAALRLRAIEILTEMFGGIPYRVAEKLTQDDSSAVRARLAWSLGRTAKSEPSDHAMLLARLTHDVDRNVKRRAWEALLDVPKLTGVAAADWSDLGEDRSRRLRAAAIAVAARLDDKPYAANHDSSLHTQLAGLWRKVFRNEPVLSDFVSALEVFVTANSPSLKLEAVRLMQLCLGDVRVEPAQPDVYAGYTANQPLDQEDCMLDAAIPALVDAMPSTDDALNREIARLLGMLGGGHDQVLDRIAEFFTNTTTVEDDIHYLIVLSRLPGNRTSDVTRRTASALAELQPKMQRGGMQASRFWPARVGEAFRELARRDKALAAALVAHERFGLAGHSLFVAHMDAAEKLSATQRIIDALGKDNMDAWTPDVVRLTSVLPAGRRRRLLHDLWDDPSLRESIIAVLANEPDDEDRPLLIETLRFGQPSTIDKVADALMQLDTKAVADDMAAAVSALRQFSRESRYVEVCRSLDRLLSRWTSLAPSGAEEKPSYQRWENWLIKEHPNLADRLTDATANLAIWQKRLSEISWQSGDAIRGSTVYQRLSCAQCHSGNARLGPELDAVARRFSREDLFTAILDPNRDVSPAYWLTQIETGDGKIVTGQILYESPESTLVQTGPDSTVRIMGTEVVSIHKRPLSAMPTGLLRDASDQDLADLYAWLLTLGTSDENPTRKNDIP
jgi:putative membrane-bound dehydrogenase-like protein